MKSNFTRSLTTLFIALLTGCSSTTIIHTKPEGAKVYVDDIYKGTTPYKHSDMKIISSRTALHFTLDGYEPMQTSFTRNERVDVGAIVAGCFFTFPFLWTMQYDAEHTYELTPITTAASRP